MADNSWLGSLSGATGSANSQAKKESIDRADVENNPKHIILNPKDLTGQYNAERLLKTTLGGILREITADDLQAFSKNANTVKNRYTKGITAKQIIDFAHKYPKRYTGKEWAGKSDIDKARAEIKHAVPHSLHRGLLRFITPSASDKSKRHHLSVRLLSWESAIVSPITKDGKPDWRKTALWLKNQPLKFDCDCGRHKFWFRYIATVGQYNEGRNETGFPKIRNPHLHGIACKHTLRVMSDIQQGHGTVLGLIMRALEKEHTALSNKVGTRISPTKTSQKDAEKAVNSKGRTSISTSLKNALNAAKGVAGKAKTTVKTKILEQIKNDPKAMAAAKTLSEQLGMTLEQFTKAMGGK